MSSIPSNSAATQSQQLRQARQAEKEANERIARARAAAAEAERQARQEIDNTKENAQNRVAEESTRTSISLEAQRLQGDQSLRKVREDQSQQAHAIRKSGDKELEQLKQHYKSEIYNTERVGDQTLSKLQLDQQRLVDYEQKKGETEANQAKFKNDAQIKLLNESHRSTVENFQRQARTQVDQIREQSRSSVEKSDERFREQFKSLTDHQGKTLQKIYADSSAKLRHLQEQNTVALDRYSERADDPFYQIRNFDADLTENDDAYVLRATIPQHEQGNVTVTIRGGNELVLSAQRRNQENIELEPGRRQTTASYQTASESFPMNWPVDARELRREFRGDEMIVTVPKKSTYAAKPKQSSAPTTVPAIEKPEFPRSLNVQTAPPSADKESPPSDDLPFDPPLQG